MTNPNPFNILLKSTYGFRNYYELHARSFQYSIEINRSVLGGAWACAWAFFQYSIEINALIPQTVSLLPLDHTLSIFYWNHRGWWLLLGSSRHIPYLSIFYWNHRAEAWGWSNPWVWAFNILLKSSAPSVLTLFPIFTYTFFFQYSIEIILGLPRLWLQKHTLHLNFQYSIEIILFICNRNGFWYNTTDFQYSIEIIRWVGFCFGF